MNTRFPFRITLAGIALGVLLALLLAPQSRWLVRYQLALAGLTLGTPFSEVYAQGNQAQRVAAAHPNDYQMQLAMASGEGDDFKRLAFLRTLTAGFGNNPSLYANMLRYEIGSGTDKQGVYLDRPEESELEASAAVRTRKSPAPPSPAALAAFDADAARGEQIDPSNAYFPLMRAVSLFAAHRDSEGLAAVQRASAEPVWNEYLADEVNGSIRLSEAAYGHGMSISRLAVAASELYPEYAPLRAMAHLVTVLAVHAEQHGDRARGMRIRRALMQDGDLMRVQSTTYIGSLVGIAISAIARARPGGSAAMERPKHLTDDQWAQARMEAFADYARQAGFPSVAARAEGQYGAGKAVRGMVSKSLNHSIFGPQRFNWLVAGWAGNLTALANVFWLLVLGLAGMRLSRLPSVRNRQPLPRATRWGVAAAAALAVSLVASILGDSETDINVALFLTIVAAGGLTVGALALRRDRRQAWQSMAAFVRGFVVTALALGGTALAAAWQARGIVSFVQVEGGIMGLSGGDGTGSPEVPPVVQMVAAGAGLLVPVVLAVALSIHARIRRVPASAALASGFQRVALPLACLLVIGYGAAVLGTLREEQRIDDGLRQMISHEGRYYAALAGAAWPGPA